MQLAVDDFLAEPQTCGCSRIDRSCQGCRRDRSLLGGEAMCVIYSLPSYSSGRYRLTIIAVKIIPRQLFEVPIQAAVGNTIIARRTLSALRADVTAGLYGGKHLEH